MRIVDGLLARRTATGFLVASFLAASAGVGLCAPDAAAGKPLFNKNCIACHYPDGRPKLQGAPDLSKKTVQDKFTDEQFTKAILNGTPRMPPYKKIITEKQAA